MTSAPTVLEQLLDRAGDPVAFERWTAQGRTARWCSHPVRLAGSTTTIEPSTGEVVAIFTTADEPDGLLLKACGQRRTTVCPQCAEVYRADAWHLIAAGLRGGKGVPNSVVHHPMMFVTLTAPSFGPVHSRREQASGARPCRTSRAAICAHGQTRSCPVVHQADDERLGEPLCLDCYDYRKAILWNALATELWRRTTIALHRSLASHLGTTIRALALIARVAFIKVIEYQQRGVVHLHVVVRLDGPDGPTSCPPIDPIILERAIRHAAGTAKVRYPAGSGVRGAAVWGAAIDIRTFAPEGNAGRAVAAYIAKYATKSTDNLGQLDHRLRPADLPLLDLRPHLGRLVATALELGGNPDLDHLRLRDWAHTLGFRGHWLTKSRRFSTTFSELRQARGDWSTRRLGASAAAGAPARVKDWRYLGRGWANAGDAWLAETASVELADVRQHAREARLAARTIEK
jgi:hypothetical protein